MKGKEGRGFVTFAQNSVDVDYLRLAYAQAMNVKCLHPGAKYAVIVDEATAATVTERNRKVFDHVILLQKNPDIDPSWKMAHEYQIFNLTPFSETIKLESDLLFTRSIDHWWAAFALRDLVLSTGCKTYRHEKALSRAYRKFFDDNHLPDVYNGIMYFRIKRFSAQFFMTAERIVRSWEYLKNHTLKNCREDEPSTDVLYAITASVMGVEQCTLPTMDFINFIHMKSRIQNWNNGERPWFDAVMSERDGDMMRVNNLNQYDPVHYYSKSYITEEILNDFERRLRID